MPDGPPPVIPGWVPSPGEGNGNPLQHYCLGNPMDRRSLVGYSPWGSQRVGHDLVTKQQHAIYTRGWKLSSVPVSLFLRNGACYMVNSGK